MRCEGSLEQGWLKTRASSNRELILPDLSSITWPEMQIQRWWWGREGSGRVKWWDSLSLLPCLKHALAHSLTHTHTPWPTVIHFMAVHKRVDELLPQTWFLFPPGKGFWWSLVWRIYMYDANINSAKHQSESGNGSCRSTAVSERERVDHLAFLPTHTHTHNLLCLRSVKYKSPHLKAPPCYSNADVSHESSLLIADLSLRKTSCHQHHNLHRDDHLHLTLHRACRINRSAKPASLLSLQWLLN